MNSLLYATHEIKELEKIAMTAEHIADVDLMERAGRAAFKLLRAHWPMAKKIMVFCGAGNNGGDGYVVARLAHQAGFEVTLFSMVSETELEGAPKKMAMACQQSGLISRIFPAPFPDDVEVVVDALLGTGVRGELKAPYFDAINTINALSLPVLAIDLPSGLNPDTGCVTTHAVNATATITFIALKPGLFTGAGPAYVGQVHCDSLGVPPSYFNQVKSSANLISQSEISDALPPRQRDAHKGSYGHVLVIGGDYGMAGAVRMAGEAAARVGAGLTSIATHPNNVAAIVGARPELMCHGVEDEGALIPLIEKATVIVVGPGLGQSDWSRRLAAKAFAASQPKVVDADGLNLLGQDPSFQQHWILTPHPGEAARLLGTSVAEIQRDRLLAVRSLQQKYGGVAVLKGVGTLVQGFRETPGICPKGNPGMASGGMGDVLSGVIGGLLAQKLELEMAARVGVMLHALAADRASLEGGERGLLATDLLPYLHRLVNPL